MGTITNVTVTSVAGHSTGLVVSSIICPEGATCHIKLKNIKNALATGVVPVYKCFRVTNEDLDVSYTYPTTVNGTFKQPP